MNTTPTVSPLQRAHEALIHIADIFEECTDEDNQWDSCDITDAVSTLLVDLGYMKICPFGGTYPATLDACPRCRRD